MNPLSRDYPPRGLRGSLNPIVFGCLLVTFQNAAWATSVIQFNSGTYSVNENGASVVITVVRAGNPAGAVTVDFNTSDGTAKAGMNYVATNGTLYFADAQVSNAFAVAVVDDSVVNVDRTFNVGLSNFTGDASLGRSSAVVTVINDDAGVYLATTNVTVVEGNINVAIGLIRVGNTNKAVSITFATADGSAQAGLDYVGTNYVLTFGQGQTNTTAYVRLLDDNLAENDESLSFSLSNPVGASLLSPSSGTMTIYDNRTITVGDDAHLRAAVAKGGAFRLAFDGVVQLTNTLNVNASVSLDASGHSVTISGGDVFTLFAGYGFLTITNVVLAHGRGSLGGVWRGSARLVDCTVRDNTRTAMLTSGTLDLFGCSFINNSDLGSQSCIASDGYVTMTNCTFYGNNSASAATVFSLRSTIVNCTFAANSNGKSGTLAGNLSRLSLLNTIVSTPGGTNFVAYTYYPGTRVVDLGHNLSSDFSGGFTNAFSIEGIDPRVGPLADNGGPTLTVALLPDSPAIDGGNCNGAPAVDQRGMPRPQGAACDIGAFEYSAPPSAGAMGIWLASDRSVIIEFSGTAGQSYRLETSNDLMHWDGIQTNTAPAGGVLIFSNPPASTSPGGWFYRVVQQ